MQSQSYTNWEMIIVDDGSTDNTEEIIKPYLESDTRIRYIKVKQNGGVGKARNIGLKNISQDTDWVGFLDSDDIFVDNALELMKGKIEEFPDVKHFSFSTKYENGKSACKIKHDNLIGNYEIVLGENDEASGEFNSLLHKSIIDDGFHFDESVNGFEWIVWLSLEKKGYKHLYTTTTTTRIYITNGESLTRPYNKSKKYYENSKKGISIILDKFGDDLKRVNQKKYALYLYALANSNLLLNHKIIGLKQTFKAFVLDPLNLRFFRNILNAFKF